jgi:hypothetical protein
MEMTNKIINVYESTGEYTVSPKFLYTLELDKRLSENELSELDEFEKLNDKEETFKFLKTRFGVNAKVIKIRKVTYVWKW